MPTISAPGAGAEREREAAPAPGMQCRLEADAVVIANENTTIGYARFTAETGLLEYIFVNPAFRRQGHGSRLVALAEQACGCRLTPAPPVSPSGGLLFAALAARQER